MLFIDLAIRPFFLDIRYSRFSGVMVQISTCAFHERALRESIVLMSFTAPATLHDILMIKYPPNPQM